MVFALSDAGAHVIVNGRDEARLKELQEVVAARGGSTECAAFDIADTQEVRHYFASRRRLDIIVNNAISMTPQNFEQLGEDDFLDTYRSAVVAPFEIARAALPALQAAVADAGEASIVNIASMYGTVAPDTRLYTRPDQASPFHYGPAKAALLPYRRGIWRPNWGRTESASTRWCRDRSRAPRCWPEDPQFGARLAARTMLGRTADADEIRGPLLFLASRAASFVTGCALAVDGGWTVW